MSDWQEKQPRVIYHATDPAFRESIRQHGLLPKYPETGRSYSDEIGNESGIYGYEDPAAFEPGGPWEQPPGADIWEIDTTGLHIQRDEATGMQGSHYSYEPVPPEKLRLHRGVPDEEINQYRWSSLDPLRVSASGAPAAQPWWEEEDVKDETSEYTPEQLAQFGTTPAAPQSVAYHFTDPSNREEILREGLRPTRRPGILNPAGVYLWRSLEDADWHGPHDRFEVNTEGLPLFEDDWYPDSASALRSADHIPAHRLKLLGRKESSVNPRYTAQMWHGTTGKKLGPLRPGFFATSHQQEAADYAGKGLDLDPEDEGIVLPVHVDLHNPKHYHGARPRPEEVKQLRAAGHDGYVVHFPADLRDESSPMPAREWAYVFEPQKSTKIGTYVPDAFAKEASPWKYDQWTNPEPPEASLSDPWYYHASPHHNRSSILSEGLRAPWSGGLDKEDWFGDPEWPNNHGNPGEAPHWESDRDLELYAGDTPEVAHGYMGSDEPYDVWAFQAPLQHHDRMEYGNAYAGLYDIPPHRLKLHTAWEDNPRNPERQWSSSIAPHHFNSWTGRPCSCSWGLRKGRHLRPVAGRAVYAGQNLNKVLKAPDKAYRTPEGAQFREALASTISQYPDADGLAPYLANRWKRGEIQHDPQDGSLWAPNWRTGRPIPEWDNEQRLGWGRLSAQLPQWAQWYNARQHPSRRGVNVMDPGFNINTLRSRVNEHQEDLERQVQIQQELQHGEVVHKFPNGWHVRHLTAPGTDTWSALRGEGQAMNHCIGNDDQPYQECARDGAIEVYSLRDHKGWPHGTWHMNSDQTVAEVNGHNDNRLSPEQHDMYVEWCDKNGVNPDPVGHQEGGGYDEEVHIAGPEDVSEYIDLYDNGDWSNYYPSDANVGENTAVHIGEPNYSSVVSNLFQGSDPQAKIYNKVHPTARQTLFDTALDQRHVEKFHDEVNSYPIDEPWEKEIQDEWNQRYMRHVHPYTGEFTYPRNWTDEPILDQFQRPLVEQNTTGPSWNSVVDEDNPWTYNARHVPEQHLHREEDALYSALDYLEDNRYRKRVTSGEKTANLFMYHVSPTDARESIEQTGLRGHEGTGSVASPWKRDLGQPHGNYFYDNVEDARDYAYTLHHRDIGNGYADDEEQFEWQDEPDDWNEEEDGPWDEHPDGAPKDPNGYDIHKVNVTGLPVMPDPEPVLDHKKRSPFTLLPQDVGDAQEFSSADYDYSTAPARYYTPAHVEPDRVQLHEHMPRWNMTENDYYERRDHPYPWLQLPLTSVPLGGHE